MLPPGLVTEKGAWTKKSSWYYVSTLKETLEGYTFDSIVQESEQTYVYKFKKENSSEEVYAVWSPTSDGTKYDNAVLAIGEDKTKATLTTLQDGIYEGNKTRLTIHNENVNIPVSESPVFITVAGKEESYLVPTIHKIPVTQEMVRVDTENNEKNLEATNGKLSLKNISDRFLSLFDEQKTITNAPEERYNAKLTTKWENMWPYTVYPVDCIIDLKKQYVITHIGIYDSTGQGKIQFYQGKLDKWDTTPALENNLPAYNQWMVYPVDMKTQYIKVEKNDNAEAYEIAFFGYSVEENQVDPNDSLNHPKPKIETNTYQMNGTEIYTIAPNTTINEFKKNITVNVPYTIYDKKGNEVNENVVIGTEMIIKAADLEYTLIVTGDINGDGKASVVDLTKLKRLLVGLETINKHQMRAVDFNFDNKVSVVDLVFIKKILVGIIKI